MTPEQFAAQMSGIESIITSLAIVVAGIWAFITFWGLGEITRSRAQLQKLVLDQERARQEISESELEQRKKEIEIAKLVREAAAGGVIEISICATQRTLPNDSSCYASAVVEIKNKGIIDTRLEYERRRMPFVVYAVTVKDAGQLEYEEHAAYRVPVTRDPQASSPSVIVAAGGTERIPFFVRLGSPGLYMFAFSVRAPEEEQDKAKELGFRFPANWVAKEYFVAE